MKKIRLHCASWLAALTLFPLLSAGVSDLGDLKEITKPYLGEYECKELRFGDEERMKEFDYLSVELAPEGELILSYKEKSGRKGEAKARYEYDVSADTLTVYGEIAGKKIKKTFPVHDGKFELVVRYGDKILTMKFERK